MFLKSLLCLYALAFVAALTTNTCPTTTSFNFYGQDTLNYGEVLWDFSINNFPEGTSDTFDNFFYLKVTTHPDETDYPVGPSYFNNSTCEPGDTDVSSSGKASLLYDLFEGFSVNRTFWAPRSTSWLRALDIFDNQGPTDLNITVTYYGGYGSDDDTFWQDIAEFYWFSTETNVEIPSDQPFSVNAGGLGAMVKPVKAYPFLGGSDVTEWSFTFVVPAGESIQLMHILAQHNTTTEGLALMHELFNDQPAVMLTDADASKIINWNFCKANVELADPNALYCTNPATVSLTVPTLNEIALNGELFTPSTLQFNITVTESDITIDATRAYPGCPAVAITLPITVPDASLAVDVDTSGALPVATATGGFGGYTYAWVFSSGDLENSFGTEATVLITDSKGCTASMKVTLPELPQGTGPMAVPVAKGPSAVSSSTQLVASVGLLALAALL